MKRWMGGLMLALALAGCQTSNKPASPENVRPELAAILSYDFEQSRRPLSEVQDMVTEAANGPDAGAALAAELASLLPLCTTYAAKDFLCRQLAVIGTESEAGEIAALLYSDETTHMARYALQGIPGQKVDAELVKALHAKLSETATVGIINTLAVRKSFSASDALIQLSREHHGDPIGDAAQAALNSLSPPAAR